jgi:hypothetical protein
VEGANQRSIARIDRRLAGVDVRCVGIHHFPAAQGADLQDLLMVPTCVTWGEIVKMAQPIKHISHDRFAVDLMNAWNKSEYENAGIPFSPHDQR